MGHDIGKEMKPYRVEWRASLVVRWMLMGEHDSHDEARAAMQAQHQRWHGQARVVSQHVIEIVGLGA